jgi:hypothetical protein
MSEEDGARLLGPLRTMDVPASDGVSVPQAIRSGKRTKALRVTAAGVFVLLIAGVLPLLIRPSGEPHVAAGSFDPLVRTISVESGAGLRAEMYITGRERQSIVLRPDGNGDQAGGVTVHAAGTIGTPRGEKMPDVNGKRALWTGSSLAFEWAPGAWATVTVEGFSDNRDRAVQVARNVRFDERLEMLVPFTVQTSWTLDGVRETINDVELVFTNGVRLALRAGVGYAVGDVPRAELDAVEKSVRPADPPVTNPFR